MCLLCWRMGGGLSRGLSVGVGKHRGKGGPFFLDAWARDGVGLSIVNFVDLCVSRSKAQWPCVT